MCQMKNAAKAFSLICFRSRVEGSSIFPVALWNMIVYVKGSGDRLQSTLRQRGFSDYYESDGRDWIQHHNLA